MDLPIHSRRRRQLRPAFVDFNFQCFPVEELGPLLCPVFEPFWSDVRNRDPSINEEEGNARQWQRRFFEAARTPVAPEKLYLDGRWQRQLNRKALTQATTHYSEMNVNLRFAVLFYVALNFHAGGPRFYSSGLDPFDDLCGKHLSFEQRLLEMEHYLKINKRIVMAIIEGRDVVLFVQSPSIYHSWTSLSTSRAANGEEMEIEDREGGDE